MVKGEALLFLAGHFFYITMLFGTSIATTKPCRLFLVKKSLALFYFGGLSFLPTTTITI